MSIECSFKERRPFFASIAGSTEDPGVIGTDWYGRSVATYEVETIAEHDVLVVQYISAGVVRGGVPYPTENIHDFGEVGFVDEGGIHCSHLLPFQRSEPGAILFTSQSLSLYVPSKAVLFVKVPLIGAQSGGAKIDVSGYTMTV